MCIQVWTQSVRGANVSQSVCSPACGALRRYDLDECNSVCDMVSKINPISNIEPNRVERKATKMHNRFSSLYHETQTEPSCVTFATVGDGEILPLASFVASFHNL
ncbi:hypothetical protein AVEN_26995-1 [Araneus ventricosus]|uniref:Uncharacterized protein n=1 Tax=Araneus ventricosus TaxID=182803 RepID=A0A4Y2R9R7_ARAVE|nr:hypothetical protein AVEN_26995-1 [Araneus ventricosus]